MESLVFDFDKYSYLTPTLEGLGGSIRTNNSDFQVYEVPAYFPSGTGDQVMFLLRKEGLTTRDIYDFMRLRMNIDEKHIGVAGLKDKRAITEQWFSIPAKYADRLPTFENLETVEIIDSALHENKLRIGHLKGNLFKILVRGPNNNPSSAREILSRLEQSGVPNYFGPQRFGLGGLNPTKGYDLAKGRKVHTTPWLKKFLMGSLQSLLFNEWLDYRLLEGSFDSVMLGDVVKKHDSGGEFLIQEISDIARAKTFEISATGPLFGKKIREAQGEAKAIEDEILQRFELTRENFRMRHGDRRMIRFPLEEWKVKETTEGIWLEFFLPKGAYATAVLREVMKKNPEDKIFEE